MANPQEMDGIAAFICHTIKVSNTLLESGIATIEALQRRLPKRIIYNSAGTQYDFQA